VFGVITCHVDGASDDIHHCFAPNQEIKPRLLALVKVTQNTASSRTTQLTVVVVVQPETDWPISCYSQGLRLITKGLFHTYNTRY
jgi:hypothetical protein